MRFTSCVRPAAVVAALLVSFGIATAPSAAITPIEELGKELFFDQNLSLNRNQSCASCHEPAYGFVGPASVLNAHGAVYEGSISGRFGNRKPPSAAYATQSPILAFHAQGKGGLFIGGNFWDGRATGERLGSPAAEQALGPYLNPMEQGLPDAACVVWVACTGTYGGLFEDVWGPEACDIAWPPDVADTCSVEGGSVALSPEDRDRVVESYDAVGRSVAAYEASPEVNAFSSKYDRSLEKTAALTQQEKKGLALFKGKGKCDRCHPAKGTGGQPALFTDYSFDNLGIPRNLENPWYVSPANPDGADWVDLGLGGFLATRPDWSDMAEDNDGLHKVPTLRNVDKRADPADVKAFGHNGYFKSLKEFVHFYNTRDVLRECEGNDDPGERIDCWPPPEHPENVNRDELGDLGLSDEDEDAIVAFLMTLSDGWAP